MKESLESRLGSSISDRRNQKSMNYVMVKPQSVRSNMRISNKDDLFKRMDES